MAVRFGGFASDFAFKDDIPLPVDGRETLPPSLSRRYEPDPPINSDISTLLRRMETGRRSNWLLELARLERKVIVLITRAPDRFAEKAHALIRRVRRRLMSMSSRRQSR